ncbi:hypothetical protein [Variovorax defluvii]
MHDSPPTLPELRRIDETLPGVKTLQDVQLRASAGRVRRTPTLQETS